MLFYMEGRSITHLFYYVYASLFSAALNGVLYIKKRFLLNIFPSVDWLCQRMPEKVPLPVVVFLAFE